MSQEDKSTVVSAAPTAFVPSPKPAVKLEFKTCPGCQSKQASRFCGECGAEVFIPEYGKPDEFGYGPGQKRRWVLDVTGVAKEDLKALVKGSAEGKTEIQIEDPRLNDKLLAAGAKVTTVLGVRPYRIPEEREVDGTLIQVVINGVEWKGTMELTYDERSNIRNMVHNRKLGDLASRYGNPDVPRKFNFPVMVQRGSRD